MAFSREWADESSEDVEVERVAFLFECYQQLTAPLAQVAKALKKITRKQ